MSRTPTQNPQDLVQTDPPSPAPEEEKAAEAVTGTGTAAEPSSFLQGLLRHLDLDPEVPDNLERPTPIQVVDYLRFLGIGVRIVKTRGLFGRVRIPRRAFVAHDASDRVFAFHPARSGSGEWIGCSSEDPEPSRPLDQEALRERLGQLLPKVIVCRREDRPGPPTVPGRRGHWFWGTLWKYRADFLQVIPASILINTAALAMPLFIMNVYDRVIPIGAVETLWVLAAGVAVVFAFEFVIRQLRGAFVDAAGKGADGILLQKLFLQILRLDLTHRPASAGSLADQVRSYDSVRDFLSAATITGLIDFPFALLMFGLIFWLGGALGWVPVFFTALVLIVLLVLQLFLRRLSSISHGHNVHRQAFLGESVNALESVKAANAEEHLAHRMKEHVYATTSTELRSRRISQFGTSFTALCIHLTTIGVIVGGAYLVNADKMSIGALIACVMIAGRGMAPLNMVSNLLLRLQSTRAALDGLNRIMKMPVETAGTEFRLAHVRFPELGAAGLCFTYPLRPVPALRDLSFGIAPGERVAVIGKGGSGKTTLLRVLARQLTATSGLATMNGVDLKQVDPGTYRQRVGYLPQDGTLFCGSVRENITLGHPATDAAVVEAARAAGVLSWANGHPDGLNLEVGERGCMLSGGQRQSVLWARALLRSPDVLLLDEPTASMDITAERLFVQTLTGWLSGEPRRSLVLATHKMNLLSLVDRVLLLDRGRILADGTPKEVMEAMTRAARDANQGKPDPQPPATP